ncbi:hypothetical protein SAMN02910453_1512 [Lachnospiraceae bacterium A10]|nr:hypothetical protein SAMN02910453_1512 [Lachnospiraceae bacterium A10]
MKLSFRERGLSKEVKHRIMILILVFIGGMIFFNIVLNFKWEKEATEMTDPTLPTVSMEALGQNINTLYGYTTEMDGLYMRNAVVPLEDDRKITMDIKTNGSTIDGISYEIRSTDTERKIAETEITDYSEKDGVVSTTVKLENLIEEGEEYLFIITLDVDGEDVYYYTRILIPEEGSYAQENLDFALQFHEDALAGNEDALSTYIETDEDTAGDTLNNVTINSTVDQVAWKGFDGELASDVAIELTDINSNYNAIVLHYQMTRDTGSGTQYYNVEEYFKVRYTSTRMYLLDYERSMEEIANSAAISVADNVLTTGLNSADVTYLSNETGTIVSFVQAGALYEYNQNKKTLTTVFSFYGDDLTDERVCNQNHDILLLNIDETGTMDFIVYGYMNAGEHEGSVGIDLYHYDSSTGQAVEQTFIQTTNSYQILKAGFSDLLYENSAGNFYIMVDGTLIKVDLDSLATSEMLTNLTDDMYAASKSGRYIAWMDNGGASDTIHVMDLEDESTYDLTADSGNMLKVLAFMDEDLVYGTLEETNITTDAAGGQMYPMTSLTIQKVDGNHETLKEYTADGAYISSADKESNTILNLTLCTKQADGTFSESGVDVIKNTSGEKNKTVTVSVTDDDVAQLTFTMADLTGDESISAIQLAYAGLVLADSDKTISVEASESEVRYYVYVGNRVVYAGTDVQQAISTADENMGIVVDNTNQYIWKRGRSSYVNSLSGLSVGADDTSESSMAQAISAMLVREGESVDVHSLLNQGEKPIAILQAALKDATVLDLTGCSMTEVLYYVAQGNPVYAINSSGEAVLIVGYDASNVYIYNPKTGSNTTVGQTEASADFEAAGNVFISYVD